jgi:hypothetical protein
MKKSVLLGMAAMMMIASSAHAAGAREVTRESARDSFRRAQVIMKSHTDAERDSRIAEGLSTHNRDVSSGKIREGLSHPALKSAEGKELVETVYGMVEILKTNPNALTEGQKMILNETIKFIGDIKLGSADPAADGAVKNLIEQLPKIMLEFSPAQQKGWAGTLRDMNVIKAATGKSSGDALLSGLTRKFMKEGKTAQEAARLAAEKVKEIKDCV